MRLRTILRMKKYLVILLGFGAFMLGGYLFRFGIPKLSSDWADIGSSSGLFSVMIAVYTLVYTIYAHKGKEAKQQKSVEFKKSVQHTGFLNKTNPYKQFAQSKIKYCPECESKETKPKRINEMCSGYLTCLKCGYTNDPMYFKRSR